MNAKRPKRPTVGKPAKRRSLHTAAWPDMFDNLQAAYAELTGTRFELERRVAEIAETRELFEQVIESMSEALFLLDRSGRIVKVNHAALEMIERGSADLLGRLFSEIWPGSEIPSSPWQLATRAPSGVVTDLDLEVRPPGRGVLFVNVSCGLVRDKTGKITGVLIVARNVTERRRAEDSLSFLAEASTALTESLDYEATLTRVAHLSVPRVADWCIVYIRQGNEFLKVLAVAHADKARAATVGEILNRHTLRADAGRGVPRVLRSGNAELHTEASAVLLAADVNEPESLQPFLEQLNITSWMCVPLAPRGEVFGAISFISAESGRRYTAADLAVAQDLARRASLAIETARLYEREHGIAETLQRSLLPQRLPEVPGVAFAARYLPASPAVGGDWYDVLPLPDGQIGVVIGDVAGRGVPAAATMGQLRNALRAYAWEGHGPAMVAERLNALMEQGEMATLLYIVFDPANWAMRYVNAGHPPPLMVKPDGAMAFLEGGGLPLGSFLGSSHPEQRADVTPDSMIVLYTDGLVEARDVSVADGLRRLQAAVASVASADLEVVLDHVLNAVLGGRASQDDVALLALRASQLNPHHFRLKLSWGRSGLAFMRRDLRRWLKLVGASSTETAEITAACGEACANAVEHPYGLAGGNIEVEGTWTEGTVVIVVKDWGRWRPPRGVHRGRGHRIMESLMDSVLVHRSPGGTTVEMRRRLEGT